MLIACPGDGERSSACAPHSHPHPHPNPHGHEHSRSHSHGSHIIPSTGQENTRRRKRPTEFDMDKVRSTLKQLVRDWSEEVRLIPFVVCVHIPLKSTLVKKTKQGRDERESSYRPIREALLEHFSDIPMQERYIWPPASTIVTRALKPNPGTTSVSLSLARDSVGSRMTSPSLV